MVHQFAIGMQRSRSNAECERPLVDGRYEGCSRKHTSCHRTEEELNYVSMYSPMDEESGNLPDAGKRTASRLDTINLMPFRYLGRCLVALLDHGEHCTLYQVSINPGHS
jgi:hypothetical protein